MNIDEFMDYVCKNFNVDGSTQKLIRNILYFVSKNYTTESEQYLALCELLDGTIGLSDREIRSIIL